MKRDSYPQRIHYLNTFHDYRHIDNHQKISSFVLILIRMQLTS